jgi:hypothetical protein
MQREEETPPSFKTQPSLDVPKSLPKTGSIPRYADKFKDILAKS